MPTNDPKTEATPPATPPAPKTDGVDESVRGYIDERIEQAVKNLTPASGAAPKRAQPESLAEQLRAELVKIDDEKSRAAKVTETETTLAELKESVKKISEAPPVAEVGKLTKWFWGG